MTYNEYKLDPVPLPRWARVDGEAWSREWVIEMVEPVAEAGRAILDELDEGPIVNQVSIDASGRTVRIVSTTNEKNPWTDDLFILSYYRMLRRIDSEVGRIESILGRRRDEWSPFSSQRDQ